MLWINLGTYACDSEEVFQQLWPEDRALYPNVFSTEDILSCNCLICSGMSGLYKSKTSLTPILAGDQLPTFFGKRFAIVNSGLGSTIRESNSDSKWSRNGQHSLFCSVH